MAEDDDKQVAADEAAEPAPKKSKLMLMIIIAIVLLLVVGGLVMFLFSGSSSNQTVQPSVTTIEAPAPEVVVLKQPLGYLEFDPPFTLRFLDSKGKYQLLRIDFALAFEPRKDYSKLIAHIPAMRHEILSLIHSYGSDQLATKTGRQKLKSDVLAKVQQIGAPVFKGEGQIKTVLITYMVMQ